MVNAFEAMRSKKVDERELTIETSITDGGEAMLLVRDNGPGIAVDQMDRVFQPFFTTKPGGLGMGLAICRSIVDFHGGAISVANNQEKGVSFRIVLPAMGKGNI
jgi:signal transduction histidine kinase